MNEESCKSCTKCGYTKPLSEFYIKSCKVKKDGSPSYKSICKSCEQERLREYYKNNSDKVKQRTKEYYEDNKEKVNAVKKEYSRNNPDVFSIANKKYYYSNKEKIARKNKLWYDKNIDIVREKYKQRYYANKHIEFARAAKRRAAKLKATPTWLSDTQKSQIESIYWLAKDLRTVCGETYHVDHIVPLKGKHVCGLHVPWNLQVLPADVNLSKGNRFECWWKNVT